jgi:hypothetical protein
MRNETQSLDLARAELTPVGGVLRAGFNMGNALLVTGNTPEGYPIGVAHDMAESIAQLLGVPLQCASYPRPNKLADAADHNIWDICLIGAEPARAQKIAFTDACVEIKAKRSGLVADLIQRHHVKGHSVAPPPRGRRPRGAKHAPTL